MKTLEQYENILEKRLSKKQNKTLFYCIFCPNSLHSLNIENWGKIGDLLARYNPKYLYKYQNKIKYWSNIYLYLARYNPEYLKKYQNKIKYWGWIERNLARYNPEYLPKLKHNWE